MAPGVSVSIGGLLVTGVYLPFLVLASEIFLNIDRSEGGKLTSNGFLEQNVNDLGVARISSSAGSGIMGFLAYITFVSNDLNPT